MASELDQVWPGVVPDEPLVSARVAVTESPPEDFHQLLLEELAMLRREHHQKSAMQIVVMLVCFAMMFNYLDAIKQKLR